MDIREAIRLLDPETSTEAINEISLRENNGAAAFDAVDEAIKVALEAMRKQVPIKPDGMRCQKCHARALFVEDDYCPDCGQAIDWSKEG